MRIIFKLLVISILINTTSIFGMKYSKSYDYHIERAKLEAFTPISFYSFAQEDGSPAVMDCYSSKNYNITFTANGCTLSKLQSNIQISISEAIAWEIIQNQPVLIKQQQLSGYNQFAGNSNQIDYQKVPSLGIAKNSINSLNAHDSFAEQNHPIEKMRENAVSLNINFLKKQAIKHIHQKPEVLKYFRKKLTHLAKDIAHLQVPKIDKIIGLSEHILFDEENALSPDTLIFLKNDLSDLISFIQMTHCSYDQENNLIIKEPTLENDIEMIMWKTVDFLDEWDHENIIPILKELALIDNK